MVTGKKQAKTSFFTLLDKNQTARLAGQIAQLGLQAQTGLLSQICDQHSLI